MRRPRPSLRRSRSRGRSRSRSSRYDYEYIRRPLSPLDRRPLTESPPRQSWKFVVPHELMRSQAAATPDAPSKREEEVTRKVADALRATGAFPEESISQSTTCINSCSGSTFDQKPQPTLRKELCLHSNRSLPYQTEPESTLQVIMKDSSDSSHEVNDGRNSKNVQYPFTRCHYRRKPYPYHQPPIQHNCRLKTKQHQQSDTNLRSRHELSFPERSIRELVVYSQFFPSRAAEDDWFHPPPSGSVEDTKPTPSKDNSDKGTTTHQANNHGVTTLHKHEVRVGKLLGRGGFCEVRMAHLNCDNSNQCYAIKYLSPTISKQKGKKAFSRGAADLAIEARFLSLLRHENITRLHYVSAGSLRDNYDCLGTNEDVDEGCCGSNRNGSDSASSQVFDTRIRHFGYFLILDRLHETLDHRIKETFVPEVEFSMGEHLRKHHDKHHCRDSSSTIRHDTGSHQRRWLNNLPQWRQHQYSAAVVAPNKDVWLPRNALRSLLAKRLTILRGIASAVKHLHDHHIIFRDIKPDNIGFYRQSSCDTSDEPVNEMRKKCVNITLNANGDSREIPKLFDFGLAKELKSSSRVASVACGSSEDAVYKLTGRTGSPRYMSPEVAFSQPYNYKVDIYSFAILLYEISTLMEPFEGYTMHRHEVEVLRKGGRPCLVGYCYWPQDLALLIKDCWSGDMKDRPNINDVVQRLDGCINELIVPEMTKDEAPTITMQAKSIHVGNSQLQLSPPQEETHVSPSYFRSNNDDYGCKSTNKIRGFLSSVPTAFPAILLQKRKNALLRKHKLLRYKRLLDNA